ncbi:hypothetical protein Hdeb2414_s0006g00224441 [Helianthus debilis subsp. tardiflorus]
MLGNCTSMSDPYGADLLLSMIERGMRGVRERNGVMGIAPPLQEVPASSRCGCSSWQDEGGDDYFFVV